VPLSQSTMAVTPLLKSQETITTAIVKKKPALAESPKTNTTTLAASKKSSFAKATADMQKAAPADPAPIRQNISAPLPNKQEKSASVEPASMPAKLATNSPVIKQAMQSTPVKQQTPLPLALAIPENAQISNNYKEVEALRRNALLQKELVNNWKPPVG